MSNPSEQRSSTDSDTTQNTTDIALAIPDDSQNPSEATTEAPKAKTWTDYYQDFRSRTLLSCTSTTPSYVAWAGASELLDFSRLETFIRSFASAWDMPIVCALAIALESVTFFIQKRKEGCRKNCSEWRKNYGPKYLVYYFFTSVVGTIAWRVAYAGLSMWLAPWLDRMSFGRILMTSAGSGFAYFSMICTLNLARRSLSHFDRIQNGLAALIGGTVWPMFSMLLFPVLPAVVRSLVTGFLSGLAIVAAYGIETLVAYRRMKKAEAKENLPADEETGLLGNDQPFNQALIL